MHEALRKGIAEWIEPNKRSAESDEEIMTEEHNRKPEETDQPGEQDNDFNSSDIEIANNPELDDHESVSEAYLALTPAIHAVSQKISPLK